MPVGVGAGDEGRADVAIGTRFVVHNNRLSELVAEDRRDHARKNVRQAARRKTHDQANRLGRKVLRMAELRGAEAERASTQGERKLATIQKRHTGLRLVEKFSASALVEVDGLANAIAQTRFSRQLQ